MMKSRTESISEKKESKKDADKRLSKIASRNDKKELDSIIPSGPVLLSPRPEPIKIVDIPFNEYENQFQLKPLPKDPCAEMIVWPKDDVVVEEQKRKTRTGHPVLPVCYFLFRNICF